MGGRWTSAPALTPRPLSVEMMLALGLFTCVWGAGGAGAGPGGGGSDVLSTEELVFPFPGRLRVSPLGEGVLGIEGTSTLVGGITFDPTLSMEKAFWVGTWNPSIFSRLSFCN